MFRRLLLGAAGATLVASLVGTASAAPPSAAPPAAQFSALSAVRHKVGGGLPLVFGARPSLNPRRLTEPALSTAAVAVRLNQTPDGATLATLEASGMQLARRTDGSARHIGRVVLGRVSLSNLETLAQLPEVEHIGLDGAPMGLLPPIDVTAAEIDAPEAWRNYDAEQRPLTGEGVRVCDSDSGIDHFHPSFFFPDGGHFAWIDTNDNGKFDFDVDGIDSDGDGEVEPLSILNSLISSHFDPSPLFGSGNPGYQVGQDWLYHDANQSGSRDYGRDAGFDDTTPGFGEMLLMLDDVNGNGAIDLGEKFVAIGTSKIVAARMDNATYKRGENLIDLPRPEGIAHGTSSAGIIAGGNVGLTRFTGIAPGAELVIATRTSSTGDLLQLADFCLENEARVMLHEYAPWAGYHVDGSSPMEQLIDESSSQGVAHINPAGNLSTSRKLYKRQLPVGQTSTITLVADELPQPYRTIITSLLWREPSRPLSITLEDPNGNTLAMPQEGFVYEELGNSGLYGYAEVSVSPRGTALLNMYAFQPGDNPGPIPTGEWKVHVTDQAEPAAAPLEMIAYVQDDVSRWSEGIHFEDFVSEDHLIGWPGTADNGIAVAAYVGNGHNSGEPGERAFYSGRGYRIDGEEILSISAPADPIVASFFPDGDARYAVFGGTSGASPHVAGAAALLIQDNPAITGQQVRQALRGGALADETVGDIPNRDWGYGKLRVFNSLYGAAPGANNAPNVKGFDAEVKTATPSGFVVSASDDEDDAANLRIEIDQDYDGVYDSVAEDGVVTVNFAEAGTYFSKLRVTDSGGLTDVTLAMFTVSGTPNKTHTKDEAPDLTGRNCGCTVPVGRPGRGWAALALLGLAVASTRRRYAKRLPRSS